MSDPSRCVVLVPVVAALTPECDDRLRELERRGYPVRRVRGFAAVDLARNRAAAAALADGYDELMWVDPDVAFDPADVDRLRGHDRPLVCGVYPRASDHGAAASFLPAAGKVVFGPGGGVVEVRACGLGFALTRRPVYEAVRRVLQLPTCRDASGAALVPYFWPTVAQHGADFWYLSDDYAFCERARRAGVPVLADMTVRLWQVRAQLYGWDEAGRDAPRAAWEPPGPPAPTGAGPTRDAAPAGVEATGAGPPVPGSGGFPGEPDGDPASGPSPDAPPARDAVPRPPLRGAAGPLRPDFPRLRAYVVSYEANRESLEQTLADVRRSDWGDDPAVFVQPADWPVGFASGARNYKRALERAAADGCDFALVLEDDVRVARHLRHDLSALPLVGRDQADFLSLYVPDLIRDPWEREEPHLGYRLARPRYSGPNRLWEKHRLWGSQGVLLSRRFVLAAAERWDRLKDGIDSHLISVCSELKLPMWYTAPCLVEHAPVRSAHGTPPAVAPDFDPGFRLAVGPGFQPPDGVPGWLTVPEGRLLWEAAAGRRVLELGTAGGRATVCLAQSAARVATVDVADQAEAAEWARRYGVADRVAFHRGDVGAVCPGLDGRFDLAFVDTEHDAASVARDIDSALPLLAPGGRIAFHDYPDPGWPDVRRVVDGYARRLGWRRVAQADYLGLFETGPGGGGGRAATA